MEGKTKKILFVLPTAQIGGTRSALFNLLSNMDKDAYQIDLLVMLHRGELIEQFKSVCNILPQDPILLAGREWRGTLLKKGKFAAFIRQVIMSIQAKKRGMWRYDFTYRLAAKNYCGKYDCIIAFQEKDTTEFVHHIEAPRKIAWIHTDFFCTIQGQTEESLSRISNTFDKVVFVSDACMNEFKEKSHIDHSKMVRVYNTFDSERIIKKSTEYSLEPHNVPTFVSLGRVCEPKHFERIVEAAARLKSEGYKFKWYVIGNGALFAQLEEQVELNNVGDCVILTGRKSNPYPYFMISDAIVITSAVESHPMVANEAFILSVPVISTAFPSAREVIVDGQNGIICDNSAEGVYQGVKRVLDNSDILQAFRQNLNGFKYDNKKIINQIVQLIESTDN